MTTTATPAAFSIADAAAYLSVSRTTIYTLMAAGELECVYVGRRRLIPRSALDEFLERREQSTGGKSRV